MFFVLCDCERNATKEFCSFFNNRNPTPQPNLRNCTWFKENSCCKQEEIDATFGTVKPLPGSSRECQRYTNFLMCYVCAPYQNIFYSHERLTVCEEFCNAWYSACSSAILKGSMIGDLYTNGKDFCLSRSFQTDTFINKNCFVVQSNFDLNTASLPVTSKLRHTASFMLYTVYLAVLYRWLWKNNNSNYQKSINRQIQQTTHWWQFSCWFSKT